MPEISKAILLMNLGSPDSPSVKDVRRYLNEFLMDEFVIDIPYWRRTLLVKGLITPFRAPRSAAAYRSIWTESGSPLIVITNQLRNAVEQHSKLPTAVCMRYGAPGPAQAMDDLASEYPGLKEVILFPLYPHYAMSSYKSAVDYTKSIHRQFGYSFQLKVVPPYYENHHYIHALSESIKSFLQDDFDKLLFSYHGVPERHIKKSDPTQMHCLSKTDCCRVESPAHQYCYRHQVIRTTELVKEKLGLTDDQCYISFQSRLGRDEWLKPYTAGQLALFPKMGVKNLVVVCPAFTSDCLETLEEINEEGKNIFYQAGGEKFSMVPCLNTHSLWVDTIKELVLSA